MFSFATKVSLYGSHCAAVDYRLVGGELSSGGLHSHHSVPCLVISICLTQSSLTAFISTLQHVPGRSADTTDFCGCRSHPPVEKIAISAPPIGEYIGRQMRIIQQRQKMLDTIDIYPILYANSIAAMRLSYIVSIGTSSFVKNQWHR